MKYFGFINKNPVFANIKNAENMMIETKRVVEVESFKSEEPTLMTKNVKKRNP
jgi:hypothetical protein